jgi:hypothetical protein
MKRKTIKSIWIIISLLGIMAMLLFTIAPIFY